MACTPSRWLNTVGALALVQIQFSLHFTQTLYVIGIWTTWLEARNSPVIDNHVGLDILLDAIFVWILYF